MIVKNWIRFYRDDGIGCGATNDERSTTFRIFLVVNDTPQVNIVGRREEGEKAQPVKIRNSEEFKPVKIEEGVEWIP